MQDSEIRVSIDRLTVVADDHISLSPIDFPHNWDGLVQLGLNAGAYQILAANDDGELTENIAYINFFDYGKDRNGIRVDFNPNRRLGGVDEKYWRTLDKVLMGMIGKKRLSRIDIAFDDFSDRMKDYFYYKPGVGKTIYSRDGENETFYYGSPMSDKQIRQYNKQREQLKKGNRSDAWWRLELQLRTKYVAQAGEQIADMLQWFKPKNWEFVDDVTFRALLIGLDVQPELYSRFSSRKKAQINKARKNAPSGALVREMLGAYEQQKIDLEQELGKYLARYKVDF